MPSTTKKSSGNSTNAPASPKSPAFNSKAISTSSTARPQSGLQPMGSVHLRQSRRRTDLRHRVRRKYHPMRVASFQPAPTHPWSKYSSQPSAMRRLLFLIIGLLFLSSPTHARSRSVADSCLHILNTNPKLSSLEKCELLLTTIHNLNYEDNFISLTNLLIKEAAKSSNEKYLASARLELANQYFDQKDDNNALPLYHEAQEYFNSSLDVQALAYIKGNIGSIQMNKGEMDSARINLSQAMDLLRSINDLHSIIHYNIIASLNELYSGNDSLSLSYAQKAYQLALEYNNPERMRNAYEQLMKVHAAMGDYEQAYDYQNKYLHLRDSLINMETVTQMANMRADFEIEQKEVEVQQMAASKKMMARIAAITVGSLVLVELIA